MNPVQAWLYALPHWLRFPFSAAGAGLLLGLLAGFLLIGAGVSKREISLEEPWSAREVAVEELSALLKSSPNWSRGAEPEPEPETEPEPEPLDPTRPGAFQYLELIAILRDPKPLAVFRPQKMPEAMQQLMVSSADSVGLLRVREGEEIAVGWFLAEISNTRLAIRQAESDDVLEYRLFDWQKVDG